MDQLDDSQTHDTPVWPIFGDLMAGVVGVFVLLLVWTLGHQVELSQSLEQEVQQREVEQQQRYRAEEALEIALADPLASGRITLTNGKIGISGSVLFATNSAALQSEGQELLQKLVEPLKQYLNRRDEMLMVSGFTDDRAIHSDNLHFDDNWQLSAERALTVTRALINVGLPADLVFAAAFGKEQPMVTNDTKQNRAQNRRVEIAPVPKTSNESES
ncbi:MAG: OmpA family protein [Pseudomonadales bacterium]